MNIKIEPVKLNVNLSNIQRIYSETISDIRVEDNILILDDNAEIEDTTLIL